MCWLHLPMFLLLPRLPLCLLHKVHVSAAVICPGLAHLGELLFEMDSPRLCVKGCVPLLISSAALEPGTWGFISKVNKSSVLLGCSCFFKPLSWRKVLRCWESFPPRSFALEMQRTPRISGFGTEEQMYPRKYLFYTCSSRVGEGLSWGFELCIPLCLSTTLPREKA